MKVLVTGASGNVGKYVVRELLQMGEHVVAAGTNIEKLNHLFGGDVEKVILDFQDLKMYQQALHDVDRLFLMRPPHLGKADDLFPFIDAMKQHDIQFVSFLSLMGIERNTIPPHHKIEKYIESVGIPYGHIRPGFFMQNISGIHAAEIKEKKQIFIPAGKSKTSFIDAEDIALSVATILHDPGKYENTAHTITGSESLDYYQIADILTKVTGSKITYAKPGFLRYRNYYLKKRRLNKSYVNVTVALYFMTRLCTAKHITTDFTKLTGKQPCTFEDFSRKHIKCFK
ncbi:NmrA family NAD(P)-binding protein [Virgibacillus sp.]|uniref:NmrA family NAD(P)-binding protein n=1 Tax=Virgibacillus sp. TaxID=1872700 RepID=UPI0017FA3906|nr:NmrA family NAD(P)-binding protein [Virgibacillus sp.]NWO14854.1 NmrA family NAD(P)-binding protein [Virgibacillus sp.]